MTHALITTWYATYLTTDNGITDTILTPPTTTAITARLHAIHTHTILPDEHTLSTRHPHTTILVNDKRLQPLGTYDPTNPLFHTTITPPPDYPQSLLHDAQQTLTHDSVTTLLHSPDLGIIQQVNALDDLIHTTNLLTERLTSWSQLPDTTDSQTPLTTILSTINTEVQHLQHQIDTDMHKTAPNLAIIAGPLIGARLIAHAGGLNRLATLPASTIQLLGAEKALFRYKKEGGRPPKHGILFQHPLINRAPRMERGRRARTLAATLTIAIKADVFTKRDISDQLTKDLEKKIAGFTPKTR
jgi:RNA processing factor Prp31